MKKYLIIAASGLLAFASCNTDTGATDNSQAIIDSTVNARVDEIRIELQMRNDSIINELAMWRADSILNAKKGRRIVKKKSKPRPQDAVATNPNIGGIEAGKREEATTSGSKWGTEGSDKGTTSGNKWGNDEKSKGTTSGNKWGK